MAIKRTQKRNIQTAVVDWLSQLAEEVKVDPAPPDWYTLDQIAKVMKISRCKAQRLIEIKALRFKLFKNKDGRICKFYHP